jgi:hypothetical protein
VICQGGPAHSLARGCAGGNASENHSHLDGARRAPPLDRRSTAGRLNSWPSVASKTLSTDDLSVASQQPAYTDQVVTRGARRQVARRQRRGYISWRENHTSAPGPPKKSISAARGSLVDARRPPINSLGRPPAADRRETGIDSSEQQALHQCAAPTYPQFPGKALPQSPWLHASSPRWTEVAGQRASHSGHRGQALGKRTSPKIDLPEN